MTNILRISWTLFVSIAPVVLIADDAPQHQRWAIVTSKPVRDSGLSELLTAELSAEKNLILVERDELLAATRELELSIYYGSDAVGKRLELGKLLKADALVLLSLYEEKDKTLLKMVIADCLSGARLRKEYFQYDSSKPELSAKQCSASILKTRQQFTTGVRRLIAVTPFLSKNLTHDHDNLQTGLAALVENSLSNYPGVAVVELEEAKSIARELRLTGGALKYKFVMLFVDGEYEVSRAARDQPVTLRLVVRINDGKKIRTPIDRHELSLDEATELLTEQIADEIAALADSEQIQPFARALQFDQLVDRATAFSDAGAWREATSLREAALLLKPDLEQRLALIADYRRRQFTDHQQHAQAMFRFIQANWQNMSPELVKQNWQDVYDERLSLWRLVALHTVQAIRGGQLNPIEADVLAAACYRDPLLLKLSGESPRQEYRDVLYDFFWDLYAVFPRLDVEQNAARIRPQVARCDPHRRPRSELVGIGNPKSIADKSKLEKHQREQWARNALGFLIHTAPMKTELTKSRNVARNTWDDSRTLDDLYRFLTEVVPSDEPLLAMSMITMDNESVSALSFPGMVRTERFTADQMYKFCQRLQQSDGRANQLYGRCGKLALDTHASNKPPDGSLLEQLDQLLRSIVEQREQTGNSGYATGFDARILRLREYARQRMSGSHEKRHELTQNIIPPVDPAPRVTFEPIDGVRPEWDHITQCSDSLDLMWNKRVVFAMPEPGKVVKLFSATEPRDEISSVVWDGENVWIGSLRSGIRVVSPGGKVVSQVGTEEGLPPFDDSAKQEGFARQPKRALLLHALGPGKCLAIGRFGSRSRVWFAVIDQQEAIGREITFAARVFHAATKIGDKSEGLDAVFDLNSLAEVPDPNDPKRRLLLVGRGIPDGWPLSMRPLAIDLATLKTSIFPAVIAVPVHTSGDGRQLFHASNYKITCYSAGSQEDNGWVQTTLANYSNTPGRHSFVPQLLFHTGQLYNPGVFWRRIDPSSASLSIEQLEFEQLNDVQLPNRYRFQYYGVSAHYGLLGWNNRDRYYRVHFDQPLAEKPDLAMLYPEVPVESRAKHHRAVQEIRMLGGFVDASWGSVPWGQAFSQSNAIWFTRVHLPQAWRGGDKALRHLQDLHNLRSLMIVQANVSNKGLEDYVGKLPDLQALQLVETAVTNEGLAHLQELAQLTHLRLEGTVDGKQFDDDGLKAVARIPRLSHLEIYGPEFTAAGLQTVNSVRNPFVQLIGTRVTKSQLAELRKIHPKLRASVSE